MEGYLTKLLKPKRLVKGFGWWKDMSLKQKVAHSTMSLEQQLALEKKEREAFSIKLGNIAREYDLQRRPAPAGRGGAARGAQGGQGAAYRGDAPPPTEAYAHVLPVS